MLAVEVADRMGRDFVTGIVQSGDVADALGNIFFAAAEIDHGIAEALMRALVEIAFVVGEKIDPAHEKREMDRLVFFVEALGEFQHFLPARNLGAIVERDRDELRRTVNGQSRNRNGSESKRETNFARAAHAARSVFSATVESAFSR